MTVRRKYWSRVSHVLAVAGVVAFPSLVLACPTCKDGLNENYVSAYAFSILFMMAVPYVLMAGFFTYFVYTFWRRPASQRRALSTEELADLAHEKARQGIPTQPPAWDS